MQHALHAGLCAFSKASTGFGCDGARLLAGALTEGDKELDTIFKSLDKDNDGTITKLVSHTSLHPRSMPSQKASGHHLGLREMLPHTHECLHQIVMVKDSAHPK
jgi:hypothetical protein